MKKAIFNILEKDILEILILRNSNFGILTFFIFNKFKKRVFHILEKDFLEILILRK